MAQTIVQDNNSRHDSGTRPVATGQTPVLPPSPTPVPPTPALPAPPPPPPAFRITASTSKWAAFPPIPAPLPPPQTPPLPPVPPVPPVPPLRSVTPATNAKRSSRPLRPAAQVVIVKRGSGGGLGVFASMLCAIIIIVVGAGYLIYSNSKQDEVIIVQETEKNFELPKIVEKPETDGERPDMDASAFSSEDFRFFPEDGDDTADLLKKAVATPKPNAATKPPATKPAVPYTTKLHIVKARKNGTPSSLDKEVWKKINPTAAAQMNIPAEAATMREELRALVERYEKIPAQRTVASPLAKDFPGAVSDSAPRVSKHLRLPANIDHWQSTGLYAAPGEIITVRISPSAVRAGLAVRIGCHQDDLFHPKCYDWPRFPRITRRLSLSKTTTEIANPFGGLIYIETPGGGKSSTSFNIAISGGVEAPFFVLGKTDAKEWERLRNAPAPWGELSCRTITLSVPSYVLRELEDPTRVLRLWERIIDDQDWLAGWAKRVNTPERLVPDVQISVGYMHSGYPVMCYLDMVRNMCDYKTLTREGNWGYFHEYGHNHQSGEWTFAGYGETTCNLFALYNMEKIADKPVGRPGNERDKALREVLANPKTATGHDHYLSIYIPVIKEFGWEPLQKTLAEYTKSRNINYDLRNMRNRNERDRDLRELHDREVHWGRYPAPPSLSKAKILENARKKRDDLRKETFVRIWSKHCKADLSAYFEKVGWPITTATKQHVGHLSAKPWLPPEAGGSNSADNSKKSKP